MGVENNIFRSEIGSGFAEPGGTPPPRIPSNTLPPEGGLPLQWNIDRTNLFTTRSYGPWFKERRDILRHGNSKYVEKNSILRKPHL